MLVPNNRSSVKAVKAKAVSRASAVALMLIICLVNTVNIRATVPVPSGFQIISQGTGVKVYKKSYSTGSPDYVTVVDLRRAMIQSYTGWVYGDTIERRSLTTHWKNAVAQNTPNHQAKVALNGTFFATDSTPNTGIAFGLKANWWRMSYGYAVGKEYPGLVRTLAFDSSFGSSSIQNYSVDTFNSGVPDVVGGLDPSADKSKNSFIPRTFVGVRDDNGDGHSETVVFFSSQAASQSWAVSILNGFGTGSKMMLDGGMSTGLIVDGYPYIPTSRTLPQVFIISSGK
jgi:hypothetical protein